MIYHIVRTETKRYEILVETDLGADIAKIRAECGSIEDVAQKEGVTCKLACCVSIVSDPVTVQRGGNFEVAPGRCNRGCDALGNNA